MDHLIVTLLIALLCVSGGVALYVAYLKPAIAKLSLADTALLYEQLQIDSQPFGSYSNALKPEDGETRLFITNLIQQARSGVVRVDIESALADVQGRLSGLVVWPRFYAQIAVYIGLLGTILGLWMALASLQGATQIHDETSLRSFASSTRDLLGSLQGAFVSALAGVLVTSLLGWRVQHFDRATDQYIDRLDSFARKQLLPNLEGLRLELLPQSGLEAAQLIVAQLDKTLGAFTKTWAERFKTLSAETDSMKEAAQSLCEASSALEMTSGTLLDSTTQLEARLDALVGASSSLAEVTRQSSGIIATASTAVSELADRAQQWPDLHAELQMVSANVAAASDSMRDSAGHLAATSAGMGNVWEGLNEHLHGLTSESIAGLNESLGASIAEIVRQASAEFTKVVGSAHQRDADLSELANRVGTSVDKQGVYAAQLADAVFKMYALIPVLEDPRPALEAMLASLRTVSDAINARGKELAPEVAHTPQISTDRQGDLETLQAIKASLETLCLAFQASQAATQSSNQKLDRIGNLLESFSRQEVPTRDSVTPDGQGGVRSWWRRGR